MSNHYAATTDEEEELAVSPFEDTMCSMAMHDSIPCIPYVMHDSIRHMHD